MKTTDAPRTVPGIAALMLNGSPMVPAQPGLAHLAVLVAFPILGSVLHCTGTSTTCDREF
jgi:hypothetical protein